MSFDIDVVTPVPQNWFSTSVDYAGQGRAEFGSRWIVEGPVTVHYDEFGESSIEMEVQQVTPEPHFGLMQVFSVNEPIEEEGHVELTLSWD